LAVCGCSKENNIDASETMLGPAGGRVTGPNGVTVDVPPGALTVETDITVAEPLPGECSALPDRAVAASPVYAFTPHGQVFSSEVVITIPFTVPNGQYGTPLVLYSPDGSTWAVTPHERIDPATGPAAVVKASHFSYYIVVVPVCTLVPDWPSCQDPCMVANCANICSGCMSSADCKAVVDCWNNTEMYDCTLEDNGAGPDCLKTSDAPQPWYSFKFCIKDYCPHLLP
jgi:hypothetical protein